MCAKFLDNHELLIPNAKRQRWVLDGPPGSEHIKIGCIYIVHCRRRQGWATFIMRGLLGAWGRAGTKTATADPNGAPGIRLYTGLGFTRNHAKQLVIKTSSVGISALGEVAIPANDRDLRNVLAQVCDSTFSCPLRSHVH